MPTIFPKNQVLKREPIPSATPVLDWIDRELRDLTGSAILRKSNILLELRQIFKKGSPNAIIGNFYRLLPRLEQNHFLLGYRIRQWISLNFMIKVSDPLERSPSVNYPLKFQDRTLPKVRNLYFEHATVALPTSDIRVTIQSLPQAS